MHLDKKMITVLIACTIAGGLIGGVIGGAICSMSSHKDSRRHQNGGYMMGKNSDSFGKGNMMNQGRMLESEQLVATTTPKAN